MSYNVKELEKAALKAIKKHELINTTEVVAFLPCCAKTFYNNKLHELQSIKDALFSNRVSTKVYIRKEWKNSPGSERIALYKLLATDDELERLNNSKRPEVEQKKVEIENREKGLDDESEDNNDK